MSKRSSYRMGQEAADIVYVDAPPEERGVLKYASDVIGKMKSLGLSIYDPDYPPFMWTHVDRWLDGYNDRMREFAACDEEDE